MDPKRCFPTTSAALSVVLSVVLSESSSLLFTAASGKKHSVSWNHFTLVSANKAAPGSQKCSGSIVSEHWVITSAHCFGRSGKDKVPQQVEIIYGGGNAPVLSSSVIVHPDFNVSALKHRNITEFYDYDVALVKVNKSIPLSWKGRPICLPCTVPASRAMKTVNSTCLQHRKELLPHKQTPASFIHNRKTSDKREEIRKFTHIHTDTQRATCVEKAKLTLKSPTDVTLEEYVPDRFLCSGGTSGKRDAITCQGDSGGSLYVKKRNRYFQVGVVSWGVIDVCKTPVIGRRTYSTSNPPPDARDFHIDVFKIMPWLKQHLGGDIQFLPD